MAEIAVQLLLERLTSLIVEEGKHFGGLGRDVHQIKDDLETMRSFLQDADSRVETDQRVKTWVKQVRDVAYDTEDVLDEFLLGLIRLRKHGILDYLLRKLHYITQLKTRRRLAIEIQNIQARLKVISERSKAFSFTNIVEGISTRTNTTPNAWYDPRIASLYMDEAELVGIEVPKNILIEWLTSGELKLTIISVVGMGGLGKTTLVKKVYDSQMVNQHFDCQVWITISQSPVSIKEILRTTIQEVLNATAEQALEGMDTMDVNESIQVLQDQLSEKRYVIIFDDIWDINVWETMRFAFPNHECGSRIIFTTRIGEVAEYTNYSYNLEPLSDEEAWILFCMKAFRSSSNNESIISCPKELEELSRNILKKCSGLPLAIVLIGGLLARKAKTVLEWKNAHDSVGAEMRNDCGLESLNRILLLSYNRLPSYLKPCFLYLSMFPEDYLIKRTRLIRLWIAEGFVEEKEGVTMEVVAGVYINELINRSMIEIIELNNCDEVKGYWINALMRETILLKSKEEGRFLTTITNTGSHEGMRVGLHEEKARRISIYHNNSTGGENYNSYLMGSRCSHIRSLMMFQLDESPARSFGERFFCAFRLLRVLDLEGANIVEFPAGLVEMISLRYLSLRSTKLTVVPKSVGKLKNMETLDLKDTCVSVLPVEILMLQRLRHLLVYHQDYDFQNLSIDTYGMCVPKGIGNLTCLQELSIVDVHHYNDILKELGNLTQLRKLGISNLRRKNGLDLCVALEKMKHLNSLRIISSTDNDEFLQLGRLSSPPELLLRLYLVGPLMALPYWIASLRNLVRLVLQESYLDVDPLKAFQYMPSLVFLELGLAYKGKELCCEVGGYPKLKKLRLYMLEHLERVRFMGRSMPALRRLTIEHCPTLEMVPQGIEKLMNLQELVLGKMLPGFVDRVRRPQGEDCWKVKHIPTIKHAYEIQGSWDVENLR